MTAGWPARLESREVTVRPLIGSDARAWRDARRRNGAWLTPWDATAPPGADARPSTFRSLVRRLHRQARAGTTYPFAIDVDGRFAGQLTVNNIVRGSAQFASVGYWLDQRYAGRGVMPRAVALVIDHCFTVARLHRIEVAIRPRTPTRCGSSRSSASVRSASRRSSCTSTARGAITASTPSPSRSAPRGCSGGSILTSHTSDFATHLWTSAAS